MAMKNQAPDVTTAPPGKPGEWVHARIGVHVLRELGQPADFQTVQVRPLWAGHYRVNVLVGGNAASATVAHSYFLEADGDGNIVAAVPALARRYAPRPPSVG
jgi:hypothetical protein